MKTTLDLPDELLIRAKKRSAETRRPLKSIVEHALRLMLKNENAAPRKKTKIQWVSAAGEWPKELDVSNRERMYEWLNRDRD